MNTIKTLFSIFFLVASFLLFSSEGIDYLCINSWIQTIHILEVDPSLYEIKPIKAVDNGIGRESVHSIAERYQATAAVNGGFFSIGGLLDGRACGALKINNWYALPSKPRGCIGWSSKTQEPVFDRLVVTIYCQHDLGSFIVDGLNTVRKEEEAILFNSAFNRTTLTSPDGEELIIRNNLIEAIERGSSPIPTEGYVLSIQKHHPLYGMLRVGMTIKFDIKAESQTSVKDWNDLDYIVGGTPLLIHHYTKVADFEAELTRPTFITSRYARTAVGVLPNGHWVFVVVDKTGLFDGMTLYELADFMEKLGCVDALNLDGGGSSTIIYDHVLKNSPYGDEDENQKSIRRVSDAIIITPKIDSQVN